MTKYQPRDPAYLDVDLSLRDFWRFQKRDFHGRWTSEGKGVKSETTKSSSNVKAKVGAVRAEFKDAKTLTKGEFTRDDIRHTFEMNTRDREALFEGAGLKLDFKESETELIQRWHATKNNAERQAIEKELQVRQKAIDLGLRTVMEARAVAKRENRRNYFKALDNHLGGSKMGKALLKIKDRMLSDHTLDHLDAAKQAAKDWGDDWFEHLAESRLVQVLVGAGVTVSAHLLGSETASETLQRFAENPFAEAMLGTMVALALGLAAKVAKRNAAAGKEVAKTHLKKPADVPRR